MVKTFEHNGKCYWVTIEPAIHSMTKEQGFVAYVSNDKPGGLLYGSAVKDGEGRALFFQTELSAFTNAQMIKKSELGE